jgi:hypothetical protein
MDGTIKELIANLPSVGDHHTNGPVIKDGYIYFGQGTATNSAIVGPDNKEFGWLMRKKNFHDIPCADIVLNGINYTSENVLTDTSKSIATTGAYSPFDQSTIPVKLKKEAFRARVPFLEFQLMAVHLNSLHGGFVILSPGFKRTGTIIHYRKRLRRQRQPAGLGCRRCSLGSAPGFMAWLARLLRRKIHNK